MWVEHAIFLAPDSAVGAVAVAIVKEKKDTITQYRALMRTGTMFNRTGII